LKNPVEKDVQSSHYPVDPLVEESSDLVLEHLEENICQIKKALVKSAFFHAKTNNSNNNNKNEPLRYA